MKRRPSRHDIEKALRDWRVLYRKPPPKEKPAGQSGPGDKHRDATESKDTPSSAERKGQRTTSSLAVCGKFAAISLYCHHVLPRERVAVMFAAHPEWISA